METDGRTVVVSGVPDGALTVSRMIDKLTIHFQTRRRSHGGDVEAVTYPTNMDGVAFVTFEDAADAERVVRKERQIMADNEFPKDYDLTVFPFTRDVFFYIPSATVDLSAFSGDQESLIQSLRSAHRSLRFQPLLRQRKATIEGPFTAVKALREDLIRRADRLKLAVSAQSAAVKLKGPPLNPRVISHHEFVSSVSRSSSKAKLEPASSNSLSTPLQTTGEAAKDQTPLSNAKTHNASSRRKVSSGSLAVGNTDSDEEEQGARSRTEQAKAKPGQVFRGEINAGIRSSLSGVDRLPAEEISAKQPQEDENTRADRVSAAKIRGEDRLGSHYSSSNYLKESDQSSSTVTAKLLQTRHKDVSQSSENDVKDTGEDTCIYVDSYIFRYIEKFDKKELDRCLRGLDASAKCVEGTDLIRILLTEKKTSKTASGIQDALRKLSTLVDVWQLLLRVNQIHYDEQEPPDKPKLIQICDDVSFLFNDVLYTFEDSCIKVIGPSVSCHHFYKEVRDRISKLKTNP